MINILLWAAGIVLLGLAIWRIRGPFGRMTELDRLADNAERYDAWRGSRLTSAGGEKTGADEMREMMRRQVIGWGLVGVIGITLIFLGFAIH